MIVLFIYFLPDVHSFQHSFTSFFVTASQLTAINCVFQYFCCPNKSVLVNDCCGKLPHTFYIWPFYSLSQAFSNTIIFHPGHSTALSHRPSWTTHHKWKETWISWSHYTWGDLCSILELQIQVQMNERRTRGRRKVRNRFIELFRAVVSKVQFAWMMANLWRRCHLKKKCTRIN